MKAYQITRPGLDGLEMVELQSPKPGAGQVLVRVRAASLNYRDLMVISGNYGRSPLKVPLIPLSDGAGEIIEVGAAVTGFKPGDRVMGNFFPNWIDGPPGAEKQASALGGSVDGVLSQEVIWEAAATVPMPRGLSFQEASTLPCAGVTAWVGLKELGAIQKGQTVLAIGTGGVSIFALQIAKAIGCTVIVTSSSDEKLARAKKLGADHLINYKQVPAWDARARELTKGAGVDHILEVGGAETLERSVASLKSGGHLTLVGLLSGARGDIEAARGGAKGIHADSIYVGSAAHLQAFSTFVETNAIKPVVDRVFPFTEARGAYEALKAAGHFGKLVVSV